MRESGAFLKITKNRITKIALKGSKAEKLEKFFKGPTAIACSKDPITLAKTLVNFSKSNEKLKILGGLMDEKLLEPSDVAHIATLPTLNEARAQILGILAVPARKIVSILLAPSAKIVKLLTLKI
jgi:large subunit ribosomal protein L10